MLTGITRQTFKIMASLCLLIVFALSVSCQVHAEPHTHGIPSAHHDDHHDDAASSTVDDIACIAAVIPSIDQLHVLSVLKYDLSFFVAKPVVPAFEFYIPPRFSL